MSFRCCIVAISLLFAGIPLSAFAGPLLWPVECIPGVSCIGKSFYLGYPDVDGIGHAFDCTPAGYKGHNGTDILVSAVADGVPVLAAADGDVLWISASAVDGSPADNLPDFAPVTEPARGGEPAGKVCDADYGCFSWGFDAGNFVLIRHGETQPPLVTLYAHLRQGSLAVVNGQHVRQGEKIAEVGSSGNALTPHLHFGVFSTTAGSNRLADPWHGACSKSSASLWRYNPPYRADVVVSKGGDGTGLVTGSLTNISCGTRCEATVAPGTPFTLRAVPYTGSEFIGWAGDGCVGQGPVCRTTAEATTLVKALFKAAPATAMNEYSLLAAIGIAPAPAKAETH